MMTDPWKVLGVRQGSSDEEVKKAYHTLVKKYHPDRFQDPAAKELANEKLKEINEAYESVTSGAAHGSSGASGYGSAGPFGSGGADYTSGGSQAFRQVRMDIQSRRIDEAERVLDGMADHNAEWHFLRGVCYSFRGWYAMARENVAQAVSMEPANAEYRSALSQLDNSAQGWQNSGPFTRGQGAGSGTGMDTCDLCTCMLCSDCLCESLRCC